MNGQGFLQNQFMASGGYPNANNNMAVATVNAWTQQAPRNESIERDLFSGNNCGINFDKYEEIPVEATGSDVPHPCSVFDELQLHPWIQENIRKSGYTKPTPVQKYSIPSLLSCRDLMSCAQTGSGKTAAFLVPLVNHILRKGPGAIRPPQIMSNGRRAVFPVALILSPTRELAMQTYKEALKFAYRTNVISAVLYGGRENYRDQVQKLRLGCHVLIATPGRLLDVLNQSVVSLLDCTFLVLDEADRMLDMGFEPQIRQIVERHSMPRKGKRVTAMFSATFPKEIQVLAQDFLMPNYVFLAIGRVGSTSENIVQKIVWVEEHDKKRLLTELLDADANRGLTLVFVETKRGANELAWYLQRNNYNVMPIHGDLKQYERERHLEMFRSGQTNILVATAVAARGLDIPNVKHVINFDLPNDIDEYVHRIGRTGRAGNIGLATSFFADRNRNLSHDLFELLVESNQEVPNWLEKMSKEGFRSNSKYYDRNRGGRFGGRDHRLNAASFHMNRSAPVMQEHGKEPNSVPWYNHPPNSFHTPFNRGDTRVGFMNATAPAPVPAAAAAPPPPPPPPPQLRPPPPPLPPTAVATAPPNTFPNTIYQPPQIGRGYHARGGSTFMFTPTFPTIGTTDYWGGNNPVVPQRGGFSRPGNVTHGGGHFGSQPAQAAFGNWQR